MRVESQTPWLNIIQYPFLTRDFQSSDGWMSYVDQGSGSAIVFLHGAPTWSYLFRHLIRELSELHRCIAPDHLGFGLSEKVLRVDYSLKAHSERFGELMDYLGVRDVTLVLHDAGGPIGLAWALDHPWLVRGIVLQNTWMWSLSSNLHARTLARLANHPINRFYYGLLPASPFFILPAFLADRHKMPKVAQLQYFEPYRSHRDRRAVYAMVGALVREKRWFEELWKRRERLRSIPKLLLWGLNDPLIGLEGLKTWTDEFPDAVVAGIENVGRFVPEEAPRSSVEAIKGFLCGLSVPTSA